MNQIGCCAENFGVTLFSIQVQQNPFVIPKLHIDPFSKTKWAENASVTLKMDHWLCVLIVLSAHIRFTHKLMNLLQHL